MFIKTFHVSYFPVAVTEILKRNNLKEGRIYFGSWFLRFQFIMARRAWNSIKAHLMVARKQ
jgi:hypothetical protein